jgi:hypothetical protein
VAIGHGSPAKVVEVDRMDVEAIRVAFTHDKFGKSGGARARE